MAAASATSREYDRSIYGFRDEDQFIGEEAMRGGGPLAQVGPRRGLRGPRPGGVWSPWGSPPGVLRAPSLFHIGNNSYKLSERSEKLSRTTFLKQKNSRNQELALGILLKK